MTFGGLIIAPSTVHIVQQAIRQLKSGACSCVHPGTRERLMAQSRLNTSLRAFRHRNFRFFFSGQLTSLVGTWMQTVAQSWLVYRLTGSAALLGLVGFASQFPIFLLSPVAGAVADAYPRRRTMLVIQTLMMLLAFPLAALTLSNRIQVWHIMVLA